MLQLSFKEISRSKEVENGADFYLVLSLSWDPGEGTVLYLNWNRSSIVIYSNTC